MTREPPIVHPTGGRARAAVTGVFWTTLNTAVSTLTTALVFLVTSRHLGPGDFGVVALAASVVAMVGSAAPAAFGEALVQRSEITKAHLDTVFWVGLCAGCALYFILVLSAPKIAVSAGEPLLAVLLPVIGLRLVFELLTAVPAALIARRMQFKYVALRTAVANTTGGLVCLWLVLNDFGMWALAASQVVTPLVALIVVFPASGWRPGLSVRCHAVRDLWSYGIFASGNRLLNTFSLDQLLIGLFGGPAMLGLYFFGKRLFQLVSDLTVGVIHPVSYALLSSMQAEPEKRREAFLMATYAAAMVTFPTFAGLLALAPSAVPVVFGEHWQPAISAVQALAAIGLMAGIGGAQASLINSQGKAHWWFLYQCAVQLTTALLIVGFYGFGLEAIMIAMVARTIVLWPFSVSMTMRLLDMRARDYVLSFTVPAFATLAMVALIVLMPRWLPEVSPKSTLALQMLGGFVAYSLLAGGMSLRRARRIISLLKSRKTAFA